MVALDTYIFSDVTMKENTGSDIVKRLKITLLVKSHQEKSVNVTVITIRIKNRISANTGCKRKS